MRSYNEVYVSILPLRADLKQATAEANDAKAQLETKLAILKEVEERVEQLQKDYESMNQDLQDTGVKIKDCQLK